jgi:hypothetical protein
MPTKDKKQPYNMWSYIKVLSVGFIVLGTSMGVLDIYNKHWPSIKPDTSGSKKSSKIRALLVGVNYFDSGFELPGIIENILTTKNHLLTANPEAEIHILTDIPNYNLTDSPGISSIDGLAGISSLDELVRLNRHLTLEKCTNLVDSPGIKSIASPTRRNILQKLTNMVHDTQPGETLIFHFSGHGGQFIDIFPRDEKDFLDEFILPVDIPRFITDDRLHAIASKISPGANFLMISESCHSGTILDLPSLSSINNASYSHTYNKGGELRSISAARDDELAWTGGYGGRFSIALWQTVDRMGWDSFFQKLFSHNFTELTLIENSINYQLSKARTELPQHSVLGVKLSVPKPNQEIDHVNTDFIETSINHGVNPDLNDAGPDHLNTSVRRNIKLK